MVGVFALLFLAALVGLVRPYAGMRRLHFGIGAFVALIAVGVAAPSPDKNAAASAKDAPEAAASPMAGKPAEAAPGKWEYSEDKDAMRGTTTRYAELKSENSIKLDFPYGEVAGKLLVRKRPEDGLNLMFMVDSGQILCNSFTNTQVAIKFDDKPIQKVRCTDTSDGSSETVFLQGAPKLLAQLKAAKRVMLEAEFFQNGRQQFSFDAAGLKWD